MGFVFTRGGVGGGGGMDEGGQKVKTSRYK